MCELIESENRVQSGFGALGIKPAICIDFD